MNFYEMQKRKMRERMRKDRKEYYSMSEKLLTLGIPQYTKDEAYRIEKKMNKEKWLTKRGFKGRVKSLSKSERMISQQTALGYQCPLLPVEKEIIQ